MLYWSVPEITVVIFVPKNRLEVWDIIPNKRKYKNNFTEFFSPKTKTDGPRPIKVSEKSHVNFCDANEKCAMDQKNENQQNVVSKYIIF